MAVKTNAYRVAQELAAEAQRRVRRRRRRVSSPGMSFQPDPVSPAQQAGAAAEELAWNYLKAWGCCLLARNLKCRTGEIDLIVWHEQCLVFVEVRWRRDKRSGYGGALASVGHQKQDRLRRSAAYFLGQQKRLGHAIPPCRFDVVAIDGTAIQWIRSAFTL